jgi:hypothetical protein
VAEWSKAVDLRSILSGGVGSNPTPSKCIAYILIETNEQGLGLVAYVIHVSA